MDRYTRKIIMKQTNTIFLKTGEQITTGGEVVYGEHGITVIYSNSLTDFIPYTTIIKIRQYTEDEQHGR